MRTEAPITHLLTAHGGGHGRPGTTAGTEDDPDWTASDEAVWQGRELPLLEALEEARRRGPDPRFADRSDDELVRELGRGAAELAAATCRWLELLAELVIRGIWADQGGRSPAQWLSWKLGIAPSTGREHVRVALRLRDLPAIRARFADGRLSYSKVRALTRVTVPGVEPLLLGWADEATASELERLARTFASHRRRDARDEEATADDRWSLRRRSDGAGTTAITLRLPDEEAAEVLVHLERLATARVRDRQGARPDGPHAGTSDRPAGATSAEAGSTDDVAGARQDAAGTADDLGVDVGADDGAHRVTPRTLAEVLVDTVAVAASAEAPPDSSGLDRHTLVIQVGEDALAGGDLDDEVVPAHDVAGHLRSMSRRTLRRLACDAGLVAAIVDRRGTPLDVGRRTRRLTAALRRALHLRDRRCTFPGCDASIGLHGHHVQHWADDGPTDLDNLVLVCAHHHRFVHEHGWTIDVRADGRHRYAPPRRAAVPHVPTLRRASAEAVRTGAPPGLTGDRLRAQGAWRPRRDDLGTAVVVLQQRLDQRRVPHRTAA
ncbi:DUF222 domain-containing protein [Nitriliruptoraceae bacterium ZYF776]|nr:DUF222 domain-containing protein [Profundirhabdus halotolerans]